MSFDTFNDTTLPLDPPVKIFFDGLVVLRSPSDTTNWNAEILRGVANHTLSIEVRMKEPDRPDVILFRHFGVLPPNRPDLNITAVDKSGKTIPAHAFKFIPSPQSQEQDKDFSLVLNLGDSRFNIHPLPLTVDTTQTRPSVEI